MVDPGYRPKAYTFIELWWRRAIRLTLSVPWWEESETIEAENVLDYTKALKRKRLPPSVIVWNISIAIEGKGEKCPYGALYGGRNSCTGIHHRHEVDNVPNATGDDDWYVSGSIGPAPSAPRIGRKGKGPVPLHYGQLFPG